MQTIIGNLLEIDRGIVAHQTNCIGATGGLAGALRRKYPPAFVPYDAACASNNLSPLGTTVIGQVSKDVLQPRLFVAHVMGQEMPGANTDLKSVDRALADLRDQLEFHAYFRGLPVYFPHLMGCGLGGGRWDQYLPLLEKHFPSATIVQLPT